MRLTMIICVWCLLAGAIGDVAMAEGTPKARLLVAYVTMTVVTLIAAWLELERELPRRGRKHRRVLD